MFLCHILHMHMHRSGLYDPKAYLQQECKSAIFKRYVNIIIIQNIEKHYELQFYVFSQVTCVLLSLLDGHNFYRTFCIFSV